MRDTDWTSVALFAILFVLAGSLIPETYYKYIDDTDYWRISGAVQIDRTEYVACDSMRLSFVRESDLTLVATVYSTLYRLREDGNRVQMYSDRREHVLLEPGVIVVEIDFRLPCYLPDGQYYLEHTLLYEVSGAQRAYRFRTPVFQVQAAPEGWDDLQ